VPVPCFLLFLCFRKATQEMFSELDKTKAKVPIILNTRRGPKQRRRGARGQPHRRAARPAPGPSHQVVGPPGPPPDAALPPIYSPWQENPKYPINFPENILQAAVVVVVDARSGGSRSYSRHPAGEGNHHRRPWWHGDDDVEASSSISATATENFYCQVDVGMCSKWPASWKPQEKVWWI
jgi:hypothetical protein